MASDIKNYDPLKERARPIVETIGKDFEKSLESAAPSRSPASRRRRRRPRSN